MNELESKYQAGALKYVNRLWEISNRLRLLSFVIFLLTAVNALLGLSQVSGMLRLFTDFPIVPEFFALAFQTSSFFFLTILMFLFERKRRNGSILLQEISDELHWSKPNEVSDAPLTSIDIRILLRSFAENEHLPFAPTNSGSTVYVLVNLALLLFSGYFARQAIFL